jgi:hypothetical protein
MDRNLLTEEERATLAEQWESESVQPIFDPPRYIAEMRAEIERLRDQVTRLSTLVDTERSLHDAEIERLREVESNVTAAMAEWERRWRSTALENERLRKELEMAKERSGGCY